MLVTKTVALKLQILGFNEETEYQCNEPERILQIDTGSGEWTPSRNILIKYPTLNQAENWLKDKVDEESLLLSDHFQGIDKIHFLLSSLKN